MVRQSQSAPARAARAIAAANRLTKLAHYGGLVSLALAALALQDAALALHSRLLCGLRVS